MSSYDDLTSAVTRRYNDQIKKACAPLFDCLKVNRLFYYKIGNNGDFTHLYSCVARSEYYGFTKLYERDPFFRHPKHFETGLILLKSHFQNEGLKDMLSTAKNFGIHTILKMITKNEKGIEVFGICSEFSDELSTSLILSEIPLLKSFAIHFKKNHSFLFSKLEDNKIDLAALVGPDLFEQSSFVMPTLPKRQEFFHKLGVAKISLKEKRILLGVVKGQSASQIAQFLSLSRRTVEHHIERIKVKLHCQFKSDLVQKVRELETYGFFKE